MRVLIACEESQTVCKAFRAKGHEAFSNDLQKCSGGHPEWHLQMDCFEAIAMGGWDLIIAHPTCTYMTNSGVCWLYDKDGRQNTDRWMKLIDAMIFFNRFKGTCKRLSIENPIPHKYAVNGIADKAGIGKYSQIIQPWMFGHPERKATCLWLYGLPKLKPTNNVKAEMMNLSKAEQQRIHYLPPSPDRAKLRSKTFTGIAEAMADQWGNL